MVLGNPTSGPQWNTAFSLPGIPWVTGSIGLSDGDIKKLALDKVCQYFKVVNHGPGKVRVGFTLNGVSGSNYISVLSGSESKFDLRVRDVYFKGDGASTFDFLGGLTNIPRQHYPDITGSTDLQGMTGSNYQFVANVG